MALMMSAGFAFGQVVTYDFSGLPRDDNNSTQQGWKAIVSIMDKFAAAKYLVIETEGVGDNKDGFGGIQFIYQGDAIGWQQPDVTGGWTTFSRAAGKTVSIVIDIQNVMGANYSAFLSCTSWAQIFLGYYSSSLDAFDGLGFVNAYLTCDFARPAGATDLNGGTDWGFIFEGSVTDISGSCGGTPPPPPSCTPTPCSPGTNVPQSSSAPGVHVYDQYGNGDAYSGANIILGSNASVWPWSSAGSDGVAFTPNGGATYHMSFTVTSTSTEGFRVRWLKDDSNYNYPLGDAAVVSDHVYTATQTADFVPAYFQNTIANGETKTFTVDFTMDCSQLADQLVGNLAIRGQGGTNEFVISSIVITDDCGNTLVNYLAEGGNTPPPPSCNGTSKSPSSNVPGLYIPDDPAAAGWYGANIYLGNDDSQWPWSTAGGDGAVVFTPEPDSTYHLTFNVTSMAIDAGTGNGDAAAGFRVRWLTDDSNFNYTTGDQAVVNDHVYTATQTADFVPAYFQNTIADGETKTYSVDFTMDGSQLADELIGNLAIRGQAGANGFVIHWIVITDYCGNKLVNYQAPNNSEPEENVQENLGPATTLTPPFNVPFEETLEFNVQCSALTYSIVSGSRLPGGFSLNPSTGIIRGTVTTRTESGSYYFVIRAECESGRKEDKEFCINIPSLFSDPLVQRYVDIMDVPAGLTINWIKVNSGVAVHNIGRNYVHGHQDFEFNVSTYGIDSLTVWATGYYSHEKVTLTPYYEHIDGSVTYRILQVTEPWTITFGTVGTTAGETGNANIAKSAVWSASGVLYVNTVTPGIVSVYSIVGQLIKQESVFGIKTFNLSKGAYIVNVQTEYGTEIFKVIY